MRRWTGGADVDVLLVIGIASLAVSGGYLLLVALFHESNRLAVASLVLSSLWLFALGSLFGLIVGVVAVRRIDPSVEKGHGFAMAGIILGALGVILSVLLVIAVVLVIE